MLHETEWYLIVGGVFIAVGFAGSALSQLPCSTAMIYLAVGALLGPAGIGLMQLDLARDAPLLRHVTEIALLVSLFAIGLRLRLPSLDRLWLLPVRLGFVAMLVTVPLVAAVATVALGLGWGPALLLAAMLSPTDPVLAHDVQVRSPGDVDLVRFALSGEGGLNDGIALPFVLAGLALCGDTASTGARRRARRRSWPNWRGASRARSRSARGLAGSLPTVSPGCVPAMRRRSGWRVSSRSG